MISPEARKAGLAAFAGASTVAALGLVAAARAPGPGTRPAVEIQILGVSDFHGHLDPPKSLRRPGDREVVDVGGAATLDAHLDRAEKSHPGRTIRVHAGDMAGASPLISSHFHDEPAIRAANLMDFDVGTLGNHEFDEGGDELLRLLRGGRREDGQQYKSNAAGRAVNTSAADFEGSTHPWIAANTMDAEGELDLAPTKVIERDGVQVGFIGVTTERTGRFLLTEHGKRFHWLDISTEVNRHARDLQAQGVEAIVVLAHSGAFPGAGPDGQAAGEIVGEAREMTGAVDLVVAGHSQAQLNERVPNRDGAGHKLVVQSLAYGTAFDRVRLNIDRRSGHVLHKSAETPRTWSDEVTPDSEQAALRERYSHELDGLGERVLGRAGGPLGRRRPGAKGGNLGTLAARAQRRMAGADLAFVDGHNMRAPLADGPVTFADVFEVHAYEHPVVEMTLTGAQVRKVLTQQADPDRSEPLHVARLREGEPLDPRGTYAVVANKLLIDRGGIDVFRRAGRRQLTVGTDLEAMVAEVRRRGAVR